MSHMSLDNRVTIQEGLDQRLTLRTIAKMVDKAPSTILREINKHRKGNGILMQYLRVQGVILAR